MDLTEPDYALRWPSDLFVAELTAIDLIEDHDWSVRIQLLLEEVFAGPAPRDEFKQRSGRRYPGESSQQEQFLAELVDQAPVLQLADEPRPYYPQRNLARSESILGPDAVRRAFVRLVAQLSEAGYFARVFPDGCTDDREFYPIDRSDYIEERLGVGGLWPLDRSQETWEEDAFYGLIEVIHDAVARPRSRSWHDWNSCGWHYSEFAINPARALYRWQVNRLLARSTIPLRIAETGEDVGRMVAVTDEGRAELIGRLVETKDPSAADRVRHAIALYRSRGSTDHDKRSAIITLAGLLEERQELLKEWLFRKDEGALFQIANGFAIRHQSESQKADYDPVFLDWIFWWYAATIELTERLISRDA
jgi:hypothetical protein